MDVGSRACRWSAHIITVACSTALVTAVACQNGVFECSSDGQCSDGICAPTGYCAFDDPDCPSGIRYGSHGPHGLAGQCVPPGTEDTTTAETDSGTSPGTSSTSTSSQPDTSGGDTASASTSSTADTSTTEAVDDTGDSTTAASGSSSDEGPMPEPCVIEWEDDFSAAMLSPAWQIWDDGDVGTVSQTNGVALFTLPVTSFGWVSIYQSFGPFEGQSVVAEVGSPPSRTDAMAWLEITGTTKYETVIYDGMLQMRIGEPASPVVVHEIPFEPLGHRFLRMRGYQGTVFWAVSADGLVWTEVYDAAGDTLDGDHYTAFGLGTELQLQAEAEASLEHIYRCPAR